MNKQIDFRFWLILNKYVGFCVCLSLGFYVSANRYVFILKLGAFVLVALYLYYVVRGFRSDFSYIRNGGQQGDRKL